MMQIITPKERTYVLTMNGKAISAMIRTSVANITRRESVIARSWLYVSL